MQHRWVVFMDLDGTVWDHLDVSITDPPYRKISNDSIEDEKGVRLSLLPGAVDFVDWVRLNGGIISTCSWNIYDKAMGALVAFDIANKFDYHKISMSPRKDLAMEEIIRQLNGKGVRIENNLIFYLDDRDIHMKEIAARFPGLTFFHMWKKVRSFEEVKKKISESIN